MAVVYDMSRIDAMEGHEFERFIADLLRKLGYQKVEVTPGSGDQGVDVLAEKDGVRYAIQCKCYSSDLGNTPVQEVNTGKMIYRCHVGVVVTNRCFTQSAREAAKATGVLLWDRSKLESLISQVQVTTDAGSTIHQSGDAFTPWTGSPLLRRGGIALKDKEWKKAAQFFDRVLNTDPENAEAYLGLVMAEAELSDTDDFMQIYINEPFRLNQLNQNNLRHAKEFAGKELSAWFIHGDEQAEKVKKETKSRLAANRESIKRTKSIISCSNLCSIGLRSDGTVVAMGDNEHGQCDVSNWIDIVAVEAGVRHTVGLKSDGTVVAVGYNKLGQCDVSDWTNIAMIVSNSWHTVGLRSDGTVVATGAFSADVADWTNIVMIATDGICTVGLKVDGTVVAVGGKKYGQCDVQDWKLFNSLDTIEQERSEAKARQEAEAEAEHKRQEAKAEEERIRKQVEAEAERRRQEEERAEVERRHMEELAKKKTELEAKRASIQMELANLKGLFTGRRRREIEARLKVIEQELANLTTSWKDIC